MPARRDFCAAAEFIISSRHLALIHFLILAVYFDFCLYVPKMHITYKSHNKISIFFSNSLAKILSLFKIPVYLRSYSPFSPTKVTNFINFIILLLLFLVSIMNQIAYLLHNQICVI